MGADQVLHDLYSTIRIFYRSIFVTNYKTSLLTISCAAVHEGISDLELEHQGMNTSTGRKYKERRRKYGLNYGKHEHKVRTKPDKCLGWRRRKDNKTSPKCG